MNTSADPFPFVRNLAIMASAGTGKTYQLAMRFIGLLLAGAKPEEIAAITFSRKAAGEILEKIVSTLSEMIRDDDERVKAVKDGFIPSGTTPEQLSRVLRDILACRNKLHIETNDSFLFQIIQAAPAEFGIRGEIAMIDEGDDRPRQRALLETLHDPRFAGSDPESRNSRAEIYQILRDISFGKDKPTLYGEITELLKNHHRAFLNFPEPECWKLPDDPPAPEDRLKAEHLAELRSLFDEHLEKAVSEGCIKQKKSRDKLLKLADCAGKVPAEHFSWTDLQDASSILKEYGKIRLANKELPETPGDSDTATWTFNRSDNVLDGTILQILRKWVRHLTALEYDALMSKTQALFKLMKIFDASFSAQTRAAGKITFADILFLINSKQKNDFGTLQVLQERLGMTIRHYLLDEFQDTSTEQWLAFEDLALNVIQNVEQDPITSFFMVGDIKQSIYQWRGGNPALFKRICDGQGFLPENRSGENAAAPGPGGLLRSLARSFRSSTPVLRLVNDVFAPKQATDFPARLEKHASVFAEQIKKMQFEEHKSALKPKQHPENGCSLILTARADSDEEEKNLVMWKTICALIKSLDPFSSQREKPLSVAVLFRKNDELRECYAAMRSFAPELNVSMEGSIILKNSMAYAVFRQLLRLAAHPGDSAASSYLSMIRPEVGDGGLDAIRERLFPEEPDCALPRRIREEIDQAGTGAFLRRFRAAFPETKWEAEYMDALADALAALEADGPNSLSPDERIELLDKYEEPRKSLARTVQLMTIHKSKGLGFDIVILPCCEGTSSNHNSIVKDENLGLCYSAPNKDFLPQFPKSRDNADRRLADSIYELGCNVYVAITRAKRSTIVILPEEQPDAEASTLYPADILRTTAKLKNTIDSREDTERFLNDLAPSFDGEIPPLTPLYCAGDPFWAKQKFTPELKTENEMKKKPSDAEKSFRAALHAQTETVPPHTVFSLHTAESADAAPPSAHSFTLHPEFRFLPGTAADFGTRVHEILRELEWLGSEEETKEFLHRFEDTPEAVRLLEKALSKPDIANALRHPASERITLFREQPFLLRTDKNAPPISGIIDRASVEYDEDGHPVRAEIIDYKTDSADDPEVFRSHHRRQLEIYRRAMSELTGLKEEQIDCTILAIRPGLAVPL